MTSIPLNLPLHAAEGAELGRLIFEHAEKTPLSAEMRNRLAVRSAALRLDTVRPYFGSLVRDPIHPSTYYLAADAKGPENQTGVPVLLHIAPAAAPTSSVFHGPILIGRVRTTAGRELVINAIPFGPGDAAALARFAAELDPSFLPQARGAKAAVGVRTALPGAFAAFRAVLKRSGANVASFTAVTEGSGAGEVYYASLWAAIREGWREGYGVRAVITVQPELLDRAREAIRAAGRCSHFAIDVGALLGGSAAPDQRLAGALKAVLQLCQTIRETRSALQVPRQFDFEVSFESAHAPLSPMELAGCLNSLKEASCAAQYVRLPTGNAAVAMVATARDFQCMVSILESHRRMTRGPVYYELTGDLGEAGQRIASAAEYLAG